MDIFVLSSKFYKLVINTFLETYFQFKKALLFFQSSGVGDSVDAEILSDEDFLSRIVFL